MSYTEDQLWQLLDQVYHMPYGAGQIAAVEQVVQHADALHLPQLAFAARIQATSSYVYGGEPARAVVTFSWCVAEFDRDPTAYQRHQHTLLWHFKSMVAALTKFPEVPLERTYAVLDDMERRWRDTGHSLHAVFAYRHHVARHIGDLAAAEDYYVQWCAAPRDELSNCVGCDPTSKAYWLSSRGRDEEAIALAEPVLSGSLTCSEQPQAMLATIMVPYLRTGRLDEARDAHRRAYRLHRPNLADMGDVASHIEFCARTGNEARAVEILERHLGWLDRAPSPYSAMFFAASGALALRRAQAAEPAREVSVLRAAKGDRVAARIAAAELGSDLAAQAREIAARFDTRNRTGRVSTAVEEVISAEPLVAYLPLSPTAVRRSASVVDGDVTSASPAGISALEAEVPSTGVPSTGLPATAGPAELLDHIEARSEDGREAEAIAAVEAFESRYPWSELTTPQRARLLDSRAVRRARADELDPALKLWQQAAALYLEADDFEGRYRSEARVGFVLCETGRSDEGLPIVVAATERLRTSPDASVRADAASRLASAHTLAGQFDEAIAVLDSAGPDLSDASASSLAALAVQRLVTLVEAGRFADAQALSDVTVAAAVAGGPRQLVRAHVALAAALERAGEAGPAADRLAEAIAHTDDPGTRQQLRLVRARTLAGTDRAVEALDDLVEAVADRTARGDAAAAADVRYSLATVYFNLGRDLDAAEVAEEQLAYRLRTDDPGDGPSGTLGTRRLLIAIYRRLGHANEAIAQLDEVAADCARTGNRAGVGQAEQEAGEILDAHDRDDAAAARFHAAAEAYAQAHRHLDELRCLRRHALSLHWAHGPERSLPALAVVDERSAALAEAGPALRWERAALDYDAGRILWRAERRTEAAQRATASAAGFRDLDGSAAAADAGLLAARILLDDGQAELAQATVRRALAELPQPGRRPAFVQVLAGTLRALGRPEDEQRCWAEYGLTRPDDESE